MNIPEPLRKYIPGAPDFIPFSKELSSNSTSLRKGASKPKAKAEKSEKAEAK
jgi:seryl-tRNA synthetase